MMDFDRDEVSDHLTFIGHFSLFIIFKNLFEISFVFTSDLFEFNWLN